MFGKDIFSLYDAYEQGEYIPDSSQETMDFIEYLGMIDEEDRKELMRITHRLGIRRIRYFLLGIIVYFIMGLLVGALIFL